LLPNFPDFKICLHFLIDSASLSSIEITRLIISKCLRKYKTAFIHVIHLVKIGCRDNGTSGATDFNVRICVGALKIKKHTRLC